MTFYWLSSDEWYPVYDLLEDEPRMAARTIELSEQERDDYQRVFDEFTDWQARFSEADREPKARAWSE